MIYINEWMPNPAGSDAVGEWVEFFNSGQSAVSLSGWSLKTGAGKKVFLKNERIEAGAHLVLKRNETKLALRNSDETIFLYDNAGKLVDESGFSGSAPEGKSFSRISASVPERGLLTENATGANPRLVWGFAEPTPGQPNKIVSNQNFLMNNAYPFGQSLNNPFGYFDVFVMTVSSALLFAFFITVLLKRNDYLSKLFFGRD